MAGCSRGPFVGWEMLGLASSPGTVVRGGVELDQARTNRVADQVGPVPCADFCHDAAVVAFHRLWADDQHLGDGFWCGLTTIAGVPPVPGGEARFSAESRRLRALKTVRQHQWLASSLEL